MDARSSPQNQLPVSSALPVQITPIKFNVISQYVLLVTLNILNLNHHIIEEERSIRVRRKTSICSDVMYFFCCHARITVHNLLHLSAIVSGARKVVGDIVCVLCVVKKVSGSFASPFVSLISRIDQYFRFTQLACEIIVRRHDHRAIYI